MGNLVLYILIGSRRLEVGVLSGRAKICYATHRLQTCASVCRHPYSLRTYAIRPYNAYTGRDKACPYIARHDKKIRKILLEHSASLYILMSYASSIM